MHIGGFEAASFNEVMQVGSKVINKHHSCSHIHTCHTVLVTDTGASWRASLKLLESLSTGQWYDTVCSYTKTHVHVEDYVCILA